MAWSFLKMKYDEEDTGDDARDRMVVVMVMLTVGVMMVVVGMVKMVMVW